MSDVKQMEHVSVIKYLHEKGFSAEKIHLEINPNDDIQGLSLPNIKHVIHDLKLGRTDFLNPKHPGRPRNEEIRKEIEEEIDENPDESARQIARETHHSPSTVTSVLKDDLGYHYSHLQSIPHELTDDLRQKKVKIAQEVLNIFKTAHDSHNSNIISGDESWFFYMHQPRGRWVLNGEKPGQKVKLSRFQKKKMVKIFLKEMVNFLLICFPPGKLLIPNISQRRSFPKSRN